jgi:cytochrome P450
MIEYDEAHERAYALPLDQLDPADPELFRVGTHWPYFDRLRHEAPVHYTGESMFGPYWSVTKFGDIVAIEDNHEVFSSAVELGGVTISDAVADRRFESFINMEPPRHTAHRRTVAPIFAPASLKHLAATIRSRATECLDALPRNEEFDWVDRVSVELTTQLLAMLFDFPWEERRRLTRWSDIAMTTPGPNGLVATQAERLAEFAECARYFQTLWAERLDQPPKNDMLSMLAHSPATRDVDPDTFLGNLMLLIVAGNDTTRNAISGSVHVLDRHPDQYDRLRNDAELLESFVPEVIRWQTPVAHTRRTALQDVEFRGRRIRKGDKVVLWYVSGNRDDAVIADPYRFIIDRPQPRRHLSFGSGIHRCLGSRLAELQLRIIWEEILRRFERIQVTEEPTGIYSNFSHGYGRLPVRILQ